MNRSLAVVCGTLVLASAAMAFPPIFDTDKVIKVDSPLFSALDATTLTSVQSISTDSGASWKSVYTGVYRIQFNNAGPYNNLLCVEPYENYGNNVHDRWGASGHAGWLANQIAIAVGGTQDQRTALGLLAWDVAMDDAWYAPNVSGLGLGAGKFRSSASGNVLAEYNTLLAAYNTYWTNNSAPLDYLYFKDSQDFIGEGKRGLDFPVPEPFTMGLAAAALGTAVGLRRRRKA